jgi:hypothetical protein
MSLKGSTDLDWFGTVRGRAGYLWNPTLLVYLTAGYAYAHITSNVAATVNSTGPGGPTTFNLGQNVGKMVSGWTAGVGVEKKLDWDPRWSFKAEYKYVSLDSVNAGVAATAFFTTPSGKQPGQSVSANAAFGVDPSFHSVSFGVNYKFWDLKPNTNERPLVFAWEKPDGRSSVVASEQPRTRSWVFAWEKPEGRSSVVASEKPDGRSSVVASAQPSTRPSVPDWEK